MRNRSAERTKAMMDADRPWLESFVRAEVHLNGKGNGGIAVENAYKRVFDLYQVAEANVTLFPKLVDFYIGQ
jgi:hypothetical protein